MSSDPSKSQDYDLPANSEGITKSAVQQNVVDLLRAAQEGCVVEPVFHSCLCVRQTPTPSSRQLASMFFVGHNNVPVCMCVCGWMPACMSVGIHSCHQVTWCAGFSACDSCLPLSVRMSACVSTACTCASLCLCFLLRLCVSVSVFLGVCA